MDLGAFTDDQLMLLFQHGREEAFEELFARYHQKLFRYLARMTGGDTEAEDVLQDVFVRVARSAANYTPQSHFSTWLYRIATNRCLTFLKGRTKLRLLRLAPDAAEDAGGRPFERAREYELRTAFHSQVATLPERIRSAFVLRELQGLSYEAAAKVLDVPVGTVKTHVHRARLKLRQALRLHLDGLPAATGSDGA